MSDAQVIPLTRDREPRKPSETEVRHAVAALGAMSQAAEKLAQSSPELEHSLAQVIAFLRRRLTGDYEVDEFGFDRDLSLNVVAPLLQPLYRKWFRVEVQGIQNVPADGSALVVANHSGTLPLDGLMLAMAIHNETPEQRWVRLLGADLVFSTPVLGQFARKTGNTLANGADAARLLANGELVGVFPEGFKGVGKGWKNRYKLQRFGRGGFVATAIKAGVPIIPVSIIGAEEIYPMVANIKPLARALGFPYFPITPFFPLFGLLGLIPLPSKWIIEFGEPVPTDQLGPQAADDPMEVFELTDQVRETIQQGIYSLLLQRKGVFSK